MLNIRYSLCLYSCGVWLHSSNYTHNYLHADFGYMHLRDRLVEPCSSHPHHTHIHTFTNTFTQHTHTVSLKEKERKRRGDRIEVRMVAVLPCMPLPSYLENDASSKANILEWRAAFNPSLRVDAVDMRLNRSWERG